MHVSPMPVDLGNALLSVGERAAQALDFSSHNCRKLLKGIMVFNQLTLAGCKLLFESTQVLLLLENSHLTALEIHLGHVTLCPQPGCRAYELLNHLNALALDFDLGLELGHFPLKPPHE